MTAWLVDTLISLTILLALVLAAREPVARLFGAGWAYGLWLLPLARIAMPSLDFGLADLFPAAQPVMILVPEATQGFVPRAAAAASEPAAAGLGAMLMAVWLGGVLMFALWQQSAYGAFTLSIGDAPRPANPPRHGGLPVVESGAVDGPIAVGFLKRRIVVPLDFATRYSAEEQALALDHELIHHRRGDIWWNLAALAMLGLLWFHPLAWIAYRAFRSDQELACDSAVAARIAHGGRHTYARALVKSATRPGQIVACPLNRADQLKRRLRMMKQHRSSRARTLGGGAALLVLAGGGLIVASPGFARQEPAPEVIVAPPALAEPIISDGDMAVLAERCTSLKGAGYPGSGVRCDDADASDPEVRRILDKTRDRAEVHARRAAAQAEKAAHAALRAQRHAGAAIAGAEAATPAEDIGRIAADRAAAAQDRARALADGRREWAEARQQRQHALAEARAQRTAALAAARAERDAALAEAARADALASARDARAKALHAGEAARAAMRHPGGWALAVPAPPVPAPPLPAPPVPPAPPEPVAYTDGVLSAANIAEIRAAAIAADAQARAQVKAHKVTIRVHLAARDLELERRLSNLGPSIARDVHNALRSTGIED